MLDPSLIKINREKCTKCGLCFEVCPNYVFNFNQNLNVLNKVSIRYPEQCCACGHCVAICPENALSHNHVHIDKLEINQTESFNPEYVREFLLSRRSIRSFKRKPVEMHIVHQLIESGNHAGTSTNGQTEKYIVIQNRTILNELENEIIHVLWEAGLKNLDTESGQNDYERKYGHEILRQYMLYHLIIRNRKKNGQLQGMVFRNAPILIVCHGLKTNMFSCTNCTLALRNMEIMANSFGLGTCWVGFLISASFKSKRISRLISVPDQNGIFGAIILGHPKYKFKKIIQRKQREVRWL